MKDKKRFKKAAAPFYERTTKNFLCFAEKELLEKAKKLHETKNGDFLPLGAVMHFNLAYETKRVLSAFSEISVFDGVNAPNHMCFSQVWSKDKGYLYDFDDCFTKDAREYLIERFCAESVPGMTSPDSREQYTKNVRKFFREDSFYFTDRSAVFYYNAYRLGLKNGIKAFFVDLELLKEKKLLKISL